MAMVPHERSLVKRMDEKPFALLGVNLDDTKGALKRLQERHDITWRSWFDGPRGPIAKKYRVDPLPTILLIDHEGIIRKRYEGRPTDSELDRYVNQLVQEAEEDAKRKIAKGRQGSVAGDS